MIYAVVYDACYLFAGRDLYDTALARHLDYLLYIIDRDISDVWSGRTKYMWCTVKRRAWLAREVFL